MCPHWTLDRDPPNRDAREMGPLGWIAVSLAAWAVLIALIRRLVIPALRRGPAGDPALGLVWYFLKVFNRVVHRLKVTGLEHLPSRYPPRPLDGWQSHRFRRPPADLQRLPLHDPMDDGRRHDVGADGPAVGRTAADSRGSDWGPARGHPEALRTLRKKGKSASSEGRITLPRGEIRPSSTGWALISRAKADTPGLDRGHPGNRPGHPLPLHSEPFDRPFRRTPPVGRRTRSGGHHRAAPGSTACRQRLEGQRPVPAPGPAGTAPVLR